MKLPAGIRHVGESSTLQDGIGKTERETLWNIVHGLSVLLTKDFNAGAKYYGSNNPDRKVQELYSLPRV